MATQIADTRTNPQTLEECDRLLMQIADAEVAITRAEAMAEARINKIKQDTDAKTKATRDRRDQLAERLAAYITAHPDQFKRPRKRKTTFGSYGLQLATKVVIEDQEKAEQALHEAGYTDCLKTTTRILTTSAKKRLLKGETIPGLDLREGDLAVYNVDKSILDHAREAGG